MSKRKIVVTGASGNIGARLCKDLAGQYELVLLDRKTGSAGDIRHADFRAYDPRWVRHFDKVDTVIHLAANPHTNARWSDLVPDNIDAVMNVCAACAEKQGRRLVYASSCQTMEGYRDSGLSRITVDMEPLPTNDYGISKLIGERICRQYGERHSYSVVCLRIGWVPRGDKGPGAQAAPWLRGKWLSDGDLVRIFVNSIEAEHADFGVYFAMSENEGMVWDLGESRRVLGYRPQDGLKS
jgi:nucleoside-diphosphate-sugar epimerase